jgi:hypothetical protein
VWLMRRVPVLRLESLESPGDFHFGFLISDLQLLEIKKPVFSAPNPKSEI